jgi:hypothetical protein
MDPSLAPLDARRLVESPMIARLEPCQACPQRAVAGQATAASTRWAGLADPAHFRRATLGRLAVLDAPASGFGRARSRADPLPA